MLCICTKFHENTLKHLKRYRREKILKLKSFKSGYNFPQLKISKGHNSMQNVGGDMVLVLCIPSDDGLSLHQVL